MINIIKDIEEKFELIKEYNKLESDFLFHEDPYFLILSYIKHTKGYDIYISKNSWWLLIEHYLDGSITLEEIIQTFKESKFYKDLFY